MFCCTHHVPTKTVCSIVSSLCVCVCIRGLCGSERHTVRGMAERVYRTKHVLYINCPVCIITLSTAQRTSMLAFYICTQSCSTLYVNVCALVCLIYQKFPFSLLILIKFDHILLSIYTVNFTIFFGKHFS